MATSKQRFVNALTYILKVIEENDGEISGIGIRCGETKTILNNVDFPTSFFQEIHELLKLHKTRLSNELTSKPIIQIPTKIQPVRPFRPKGLRY